MSAKTSPQQFGSSAVGIFDEHADIGAVLHPGSAVYDSTKQAYTLRASGTNMWGEHDEFHFVWKRISGDFVFQGRVTLVGPGADPHRKAGLIIRSSLEPHSPHVNACRHGDGLTSFQFRRTEGGPTEQLVFAENGPDVLEIRRRGKTLVAAVARHGEPYATHELSDVDLGDEVYVGIYVCAHNNSVVEEAQFWNVRLVRPAKPDFRPYHDYISSDLELMDVSTGERQSIHHTEDSLQAPNWTPDGKTLICNRNGRMLRFDLATRQPEWIDTGAQVQCNNDHALSFDGKMMAISSGSPSIVYTLPVTGGTPKQITPIGPSYFHGWSPDGKTLTFTGGRGDKPYEIFVIPAEGGAEKRLTLSSGLDDGSEYTPDGRYIYFNSDRTGRMQVWRMKPDGSEQEQVTFDDFNNWFPHISPDGKSLVFISYGPEIRSGDHPFYKHVYLRTLPLEGGKPTVVAYLYGGQGSMNVNSWSPDSRSIAFVSNGDWF